MEERVQQLVENAIKNGFSYAKDLDCLTLEFMPEVRDMCAADRCHAYNRCWTCPPACGTIQDCAERAANYHNGIIVQTVGDLEDQFDYESMVALEQKHKKAFSSCLARIREEYDDVLALGAGGCHLCKTCTYPDKPCRQPDKALSSMEAYGLLVSDVCKKNGMKYYYGEGTLAYTSCYLFK